MNPVAQLSEQRDFVHHHIGQLNRALVGWFEFARKTLDAAEANVAALRNHASQLAQPNRQSNASGCRRNS
jgi:hypothetical protein